MALFRRKGTDWFIYFSWLFGIYSSQMYGFVVGLSGIAGQLLLVTALIWPMFMYALKGKLAIPSWRFEHKTLVVFFGLSSFISALSGLSPLQSLLYWIVTFVGILTASYFLNVCDSEDRLRVYRFSGFMSLVVLCLIAIFDFRSFEGYRLGMGPIGINPNSLGMMGMFTGITALAWRSIIMRVPLVLASALIIHMTGSRASALALISALFMFYSMQLKGGSSNSKVLSWIGFFVLLVSLAFFPDFWWGVVDEVFKVSDPHRGIDSGGSGRMELWSESLMLFENNMAFGVGFRSDGYLIHGSSPHNGYIALLTEGGVLTFIPVMILLIAAFLRLKRLAELYSPSAAHSMEFAFFIAFCALAIFERYLLNVGNPASLIFLGLLFSDRRRV